MPSDPHDALRELAARLRDEGTEISRHVAGEGAGERGSEGTPPSDGGPEATPALGLLAGAGPRARAAPGEYALVVEAVREGYLLHYGEAAGDEPRLVRGADRDLALLAGDYLYALGLERLAGLGDLDAVRELGDLISLAAQLHADEGPQGAVDPPPSPALWLAATTAIAAGSGEGHERAKRALRAGEPDAPRALVAAASIAAAEAGIGAELGAAAEALAGGTDAIDFSSLDPSGLG